MEMRKRLPSGSPIVIFTMRAAAESVTAKGAEAIAGACALPAAEIWLSIGKSPVEFEVYEL